MGAVAAVSREPAHREREESQAASARSVRGPRREAQWRESSAEPRVDACQDNPVKPSEIAARVNGISTPFGGISWVPAVSDMQVARRVIAFIEVRRVLFGTYANEVPDQCVQSVIEIRNFLTEVIGAGGIADELEQPLRLARGFALRFLDRVGATERSLPDGAGERHLFARSDWRMHDYWFGEALGELRAGAAIQVGVIAARYKIDVEDDLASMLPDAT